LTGIEAEELIYKIVSKVKDMVAIKMGAGKEDLGIQKDFPYNKSKRDAKNWKREDLESFYTKLVEIYHRSRMEARLAVGQGGCELDIALEEIILST